MRTMYDSVTPAAIPDGVQMVAGYLDGKYPWRAQDWARWPDAVKVGIVVSRSTDNGHVLDVERGDAGPGDAPRWVVMRRDAGADPSVYCQLSSWPACRAAFARAGVPEPHWWVAAWGRHEVIPPGAVALQYQAAGSFDLSVVEDYWPGVDGGQTIAPVEPAADLGVDLVAAAAALSGIVASVEQLRKILHL